MERSKTDGVIGCLKTIDERCELMPIARENNLAQKSHHVYPRVPKLRGIQPLPLRSKYNGSSPSTLRKISSSHQHSVGMRHHSLRCPNVVASHSLTSTISSSRRECKSIPDDNGSLPPFRSASTTRATTQRPSHSPIVEHRSSINDPRFRKVISPASNKWERRSPVDSNMYLNEETKLTNKNSPRLVDKIPDEHFGTVGKDKVCSEGTIKKLEKIEAGEAQSRIPKGIPNPVNNSPMEMLEEEFTESSSSPSSDAETSISLNSVISADKCVKTTRLQIDYTEKICNVNNAGCSASPRNSPKEYTVSKCGKSMDLSTYDDGKPDAKEAIPSEYGTGEDSGTDTQSYSTTRWENQKLGHGEGDFREELKKVKESKYFTKQHTESYSESSYGEPHAPDNKLMKCGRSNCRNDKRNTYGISVHKNKKAYDSSSDSEFGVEVDTYLEQKHSVGGINWRLLGSVLSTIILFGVVLAATYLFIPIYLEWLASIYPEDNEDEEITTSDSWIPDIFSRFVSFLISVFTRPRPCNYPEWISRKLCRLK